MFVVTYVVLRWVVRSHMGLAFKTIGQRLPEKAEQNNGSLKEVPT